MSAFALVYHQLSPLLFFAFFSLHSLALCLYRFIVIAAIVVVKTRKSKKFLRNVSPTLRRCQKEETANNNNDSCHSNFAFPVSIWLGSVGYGVNFLVQVGVQWQWFYGFTQTHTHTLSKLDGIEWDGRAGREAKNWNKENETLST